MTYRSLVTYIRAFTQRFFGHFAIAFCSFIYVNEHRRNSDGGNDDSQSRETLTERTPQQSSRLYGKVIIDFDQERGYLRLVTATSAQLAESLLSWDEPVGQHYGA